MPQRHRPRLARRRRRWSFWSGADILHDDRPGDRDLDVGQRRPHGGGGARRRRPGACRCWRWSTATAASLAEIARPRSPSTLPTSRRSCAARRATPPPSPRLMMHRRGVADASSAGRLSRRAGRSPAGGARGFRPRAACRDRPPSTRHPAALGRRRFRHGAIRRRQVRRADAHRRLVRPTWRSSPTASTGRCRRPICRRHRRAIRSSRDYADEFLRRRSPSLGVTTLAIDTAAAPSQTATHRVTLPAIDAGPGAAGHRRCRCRSWPIALAEAAGLEPEHAPAPQGRCGALPRQPPADAALAGRHGALTMAAAKLLVVGYLSIDTVTIRGGRMTAHAGRCLPLCRPGRASCRAPRWRHRRGRRRRLSRRLARGAGAALGSTLDASSAGRDPTRHADITHFADGRRASTHYRDRGLVGRARACAGRPCRPVAEARHDRCRPDAGRRARSPGRGRARRRASRSSPIPARRSPAPTRGGMPCSSSPRLGVFAPSREETRLLMPGARGRRGGRGALQHGSGGRAEARRRRAARRHVRRPQDRFDLPALPPGSSIRPAPATPRSAPWRPVCMADATSLASAAAAALHVGAVAVRRIGPARSA